MVTSTAGVGKCRIPRSVAPAERRLSVMKAPEPKAPELKAPEVKAGTFDRAFDAGGDVSGHVDWARARRPNLEARRVNVDFPAWVVDAPKP